jgi:hypothetical protein
MLCFGDRQKRWASCPGYDLWTIPIYSLLTLRQNMLKWILLARNNLISCSETIPSGFGWLDRVSLRRAGTRMHKQVAASARSLLEAKTTHPPVCCLCCSRATRLFSSDRPRSVRSHCDSLNKYPTAIPRAVAMQGSDVVINAEICAIPIVRSPVAVPQTVPVGDQCCGDAFGSGNDEDNVYV